MVKIDPSVIAFTTSDTVREPLSPARPSVAGSAGLTAVAERGTKLASPCPSRDGPSERLGKGERRRNVRREARPFVEGTG